ncbi:MAG: DoxX family protein [Deltaproteobacteria bacterium]|nr:DoxX family protein [Deltaproteobacteria bacterium]
MAANVYEAPRLSIPSRDDTRTRATSARVLAPIGRVLFGLIFLTSGVGHFTQPVIAYGASMGVPMPNVLVPLSGIIAVIGALSVMLGYKTHLGATLLVIFLAPVAYYMHPFWKMDDAMMRLNQQAHFMKNISMLGAALALIYFGAGPISLDARKNVKKNVKTGRRATD